MNHSYQEEKINTRIQLHQLFVGLWPYMKRQPFLLTLALLFTLAHIISARLLPVIIGYAIDKGVLNQDLNAFISMAFIYSFLQILNTGSHFIYQISFSRMGNIALYHIRKDLLAHVQNLNLNYFNKNPIGRLVNRLTSDPNNLQEVFTEGLVNMGVQVIMLISIVISMLLISWKLTLISLITIPLFFWLSIKVTQKMRVCQRDSKNQIGTISAFATERLQGLKTLQLLCLSEATSEQFCHLSNKYKSALISVIKAGAALHPVLNLATALIISSLLMASGYFSTSESLSLGAITTLILHGQDFIHPLRGILERYQQFQNSLTSAERVFPIFNEKTELLTFQTPKSSNENEKLSPIMGKISIKALSFQYDNNSLPIFKEASLTIEAGEKIALVGRTGAGKSTLISLLQGFYSPQAGSIYLDDKLLSDWPLPILRKNIGVIQQDPFVFRGTLKDNMTIGNKEISDEDLLTQLEDLDLKHYFESRGMSLDFWIEEKGQNISLGERQLINFVRIFIFNPRILIFDEATANMDSVTESLLQKSIEKLTQNRTTILIAHRLSTLNQCNKVYLVNKGQITKTTLKEVENNPELLS